MHISSFKGAREIAGILVVTFLVCAFFRWGHWSFSPRPSQEQCKQWLGGQKLVVQKGVLFDDYWTIRYEEFSAFKFAKIGRRGSAFQAQVQFELRSAQKGLWVEAIIAYEIDAKEKHITFQSFNPITIVKRGSW